MLLAIDSGNTNTTFAVLAEDGSLIGSWRTATSSRRTSDEYAVWLLQLMALKQLGAADITDVVIANVVPDLAFNLDRLCRDYFGVSPKTVGDPGVDLGLAVKTDRPEEVGADRLVNAVAAHAVHAGPLIVIDFGTATTFDIVDSDGAYCGGVIAPGINLSLEALYMAAAKLPGVAIRRPGKVIGTNTVGAMQAGVYWGYVGLIEGLVTRIRAEYGRSHGGEPAMRVVATGGLAPLFAAATAVIDVEDDDLTMRGLHIIHRRNLRPRES